MSNQRFKLNKRFFCDFESCNKDFRDNYALKRHKTIHERNQGISFREPVTSSNVFVGDNEEVPETTTQLAPVEAISANLENMVFYDDLPEVADFSDVEDENDELVESNGGFTESTIDEFDEEASEVEEQDHIFISGDFFPFKDKIHLLMHQFYYRFGGDISQSLMKDVVKLVNDVVQAKQEYPESKVPSADLIFNYDDVRRTRNQIPVFKQTTHQVTISKQGRNGQEVQEIRPFSMNPPSEILRFLVANPAVSERISRLPDDTEDELIESYQSYKWRSHELFQHPMVTVDINQTEKDIWVGDLVQTEHLLLVADRFFTLKHNEIMVEGYEVSEEADGRFSLCNMPHKVKVKVNDITSVRCDDPESLNLLPDSNVASELSDAIIQKLKTSNPLKRPSNSSSRKFMPVKVVPLNLFTDDMSGNRTKKHNKFDSWIMVPAALPLSERHALNNTAFICTDHLLSAVQMLPALVENLVLLENGVEMRRFDGEPVVVVAPLQFISADNARHSELASTRGAISQHPCRKCTWQLKTPPRYDGEDYRCTHRSESVVADMHNTYLATGNQKALLNKETGYKLVGGQALLRLKSFDTMKDCPIELLHTIMLGVGKSLVKCLLNENDFLIPAEKSLLESKLFGYDSKGFTRKLRSSLRLHGSFLGRDYKILMQQVPILLSQMLLSGEIVDRSGGLILISKCFNDLGRLVSLLYITKFNPNLYFPAVTATYDDLRRSVMTHDQHLKLRFPTRRGVINIYNSSKMHIMYHLTEDIFRFGSAIFYETEKGEQFNKFIRECLFRTNRQNPSRDAAVAFSKRLVAGHIMTGGSWKVAGQDSLVKCSPRVLATVSSFAPTVRDFADNDNSKLLVKVGSTGVFQNRYGNLLIGEVSKIDSLTGTITLVEYALLFADQQVTRFAKYNVNDSLDCVYMTCIKDAGGNLIIRRLTTTCTIKEDEGRFVDVLDISRKHNNLYNLVNISKFGTFWWALSHKILINQ